MRLKRICFTVVSIILSFAVSAQTFTSQNGTFAVDGPYDGPNIHGEVTITNVSGQALDLICRISSANMTTGHTRWFCFGPICYPPNVTVSMTTNVNAGDTALLIAYCAPNDSEGVSIINYEIFDANGNSDTISFSFAYSFTYAGINEFFFSGNSLSTASPNPANNVTVISYRMASAKNASLVFYNLAGNKVKEIMLGANRNTLLLSVSDFADGVYTYMLVVDGRAAASKKLLVAHQ
jgi:hypothetical protein